MLRFDSDQDGWMLEDAEARQRDSPDTFRIPPLTERAAIVPGDLVQLCFFIRSHDAHGPFIASERLWVRVSRTEGAGFVGALESCATCSELLRSGQPVAFEPRHVAALGQHPPVGRA